MKLELHMIQNFAPACLNRDDTNSPKDCVFGGVRRARISSQCIKRAIRQTFREENLIPTKNLAFRTKRLAEEVAKRLSAEGKDLATGQIAAETAIGGLGLGVGDDGQTQYLLFLGESGVAALTELCSQNWDKLAEAAAKIKGAESAAEEGDKKAQKSAKDAKQSAKDAVPDEIRKAMSAVLDGSKAADLALFGRMLADTPKENIDAACQVAHAISTNRVDMEMDFFTAVDDLKTNEDDAGAGMMGVVGYNSSCFYRYAVIDHDDLLKNLGNDADLAGKTIEAFLRASATAVPSGKQNTFAAHNPPDFVLAVARREGAPISLANAFVDPARPRDGKSLTQTSVNMMKDYHDKVTAVYGSKGDIAGTFCCGLTHPSSSSDTWSDAGSLDNLITQVMDVVCEGETS